VYKGSIFKPETGCLLIPENKVLFRFGKFCHLKGITNTIWTINPLLFSLGNLEMALQLLHYFIVFKSWFLKEFQVNSLAVKKLNYLLSFIFVFSISMNSPRAEEAPQETSITTISEVSPGHQIILTNINGTVGTDAKAEAIIKLLELAPPNKTIFLVFKPTNQNKAGYRTLNTLITAAIEKVKKEKNVRVESIFINDEIAKMTSDYISTQNPELPNQDVYVTLQKDDVWFLEEAPTNLVEKIESSKNFLAPSVAALKGTFKEAGTAIVETKWSGLLVATALTTVGTSTLAPSWVYISEGDMSFNAATVLALSTAYLYSVPRNEKLTRRIYEFGFEVARSGMNFFKYLGNKANFLSDRRFYLNEAKPYNFYAFRAVAAGLYAVPFVALSYYLKDGVEISNPEYLEYIARNSILLGTASAPWTFVTEKLKSDTSLSPNLITHLRTIQLMTIGALAVGIPYGIDSIALNINSGEEGLLLAMGAIGTGLAIFNKPLVKIINKLDQNKWFRYVQRNYEAITNAGPNFVSNALRKLIRRGTPVQNGFLSLNRAESEINGFNSISHTCGNFLR
jgi:hypothetical protein